MTATQRQETRRRKNLIRVKHLTRRTEDHMLGTRYLSYCGTWGVSSRDFAPNLTNGGKPVVNCPDCIGKIKPIRQKEVE